MAEIEFFCKECADKTDELESLTLGCLGYRECVVCGRWIDTLKEEYAFFRAGAKARLKSKEKKAKEKEMNSVQLVGNLGKDPNFNIVGEKQTSICELSIATTDYRGGQNVTEWHSVKCFGKMAEAARDYLFRGAKVGIVGRLTTRSWEKDGKKLYRTEVIADKLEFLSKKDERSTGTQGDATRAKVNESIPDAGNIEDMGGEDSDLPF